jgi:uncharacterized membrane protein
MDPERSLRCSACGHELSTYEPPIPATGERAATKLTGIVASWAFPTAILVAVIVWGIINIATKPLEPYPVVVLAWISAVLATVAACQGPLILLSQRRAAMNDRARDEETFRVAMHTETDLHALGLSIAELNTKIDALTATT